MTGPRTIPCKHCSGTGRVEMENPYARLSCAMLPLCGPRP